MEGVHLGGDRIPGRGDAKGEPVGNLHRVPALLKENVKRKRWKKIKPQQRVYIGKGGKKQKGGATSSKGIHKGIHSRVNA